MKVVSRYTYETICIIKGNTSHAKLEGRCLANALFDGENLSCAVLTSANLFNASMTEANMEFTALCYTNLSGANLTGANLRSAVICNANLEGTVLDEADLSNALLHDCILTGASLTDTLINWRSHDLIAEILRRRAGETVAYRRLAGLILVSNDWCFKDWTKVIAEYDFEIIQWAYDCLKSYDVEINPMPGRLRFPLYDRLGIE